MALYAANGYEMRTLDSVSEEAFAEVFRQISQRGNPLLQGRPQEDLLELGRLLYSRSVEDPFSTVMVRGDEIVAISTGWDMGAGPLWAGRAVPSSLRCHATVAAECCGSLGSSERVHFGAFSGVVRGHPKELLIPGIIFSLLGGAHMGYDYRFGYTIHPSMLAWMNQEKGQGQNNEIGFHSLDRSWELPYAGMDASDDVHAQLSCLKLDRATCTLTDLCMLREHYDLLLGTVDISMRPLLEMMNSAAQAHLRSKNIPFVDPLMATQPLQLSAVPVSSKL